MLMCCDFKDVDESCAPMSQVDVCSSEADLL